MKGGEAVMICFCIMIYLFLLCIYASNGPALINCQIFRKVFTTKDLRTILCKKVSTKFMNLYEELMEVCQLFMNIVTSSFMRNES